MHHFKATGQFKLELQFPNTQFGSKSAISCAMWPWNLMDDLNIRESLLCFCKLCASFHSHRWIPKLQSGNAQIGLKLAIFVPCELGIMWSWPLTLTFWMGINFVNSNHSWKVHDYTMRGTLSKRCDRQSWNTLVCFINSRISYDIEVYGHWADKYLIELQTLHNKLLKLMLKPERCTSTNQMHRNISLLQVSEIHTISVLCFVNNCRATRCLNNFATMNKLSKQSVNFVIMTTLIYPGLEPIWVLAQVTLKELDYGMKTFRQSIPIYIKNMFQSKRSSIFHREIRLIIV